MNELDFLDYDDDFGPGFKQKSMWDQLGKILDSEDASKDEKKFKPVNTVITDDGVTFEVSPLEANAIKAVLLRMHVPDRREMIHQIQLAEGFSYIHNFVKEHVIPRIKRP